MFRHSRVNIKVHVLGCGWKPRLLDRMFTSVRGSEVDNPKLSNTTTQVEDLETFEKQLFILTLIFNFCLIQINGTKVDGLGFVAARQHLDAARPVARLLVERRPRLVESKYAMGQQTNSEVLSPSQSLDIPDQNMTGSSDEEGYGKDDKSEKKENEDEDEESHVGF